MINTRNVFSAEEKVKHLFVMFCLKTFARRNLGSYHLQLCKKGRVLGKSVQFTKEISTHLLSEWKSRKMGSIPEKSQNSSSLVGCLLLGTSEKGRLIAVQSNKGKVLQEVKVKMHLLQGAAFKMVSGVMGECRDAEFYYRCRNRKCFY